jgi:hypothetical protein
METRYWKSRMDRGGTFVVQKRRTSSQKRESLARWRERGGVPWSLIGGSNILYKKRLLCVLLIERGLQRHTTSSCLFRVKYTVGVETNGFPRYKIVCVSKWRKLLHSRINAPSIVTASLPRSQRFPLLDNQVKILDSVTSSTGEEFFLTC